MPWQSLGGRNEWLSDARIESAEELSGETRQQILENLKRKYGSDLTSEFIVTPELLGGLRVR
ncbi:MAG: F0F1 ATP synthase subunit delta, partial [Thermoanaerobaculia bacterium]